MLWPSRLLRVPGWARTLSETKQAELWGGTSEKKSGCVVETAQIELGVEQTALPEASRILPYAECSGAGEGNPWTASRTWVEHELPGVMMKMLTLLSDPTVTVSGTSACQRSAEDEVCIHHQPREDMDLIASADTSL